MDTCGSRIKALREAANLTQEQLGAKTGVSGVTIMRYEKGQRQPRLEALELIADALNVSVAYLLGEKYTVQELLAVKEKLDESTATYDEWQRYWEQVGRTPRKEKLCAVFELLNETGQAVAIERLKELAEIPKYQRNDAASPLPDESGV